MGRWLVNLLGWLLRWPLALLILFEEWGWEPLQHALVRLSERLRLRWLEPRIRALPPYPALALYAVPALLLLPVKLLALAAIGSGHVVLGAAVIVTAKVAGTAVLARLFTLTRPALMRLPWFARCYEGWTAWKEALLAQVRASATWQAARVMRRWLGLRWAALRRR
ncbi:MULTISPECIES: hypothetical protein [Ramlibacter]|uniref:Transmembrane protein n=1 Tax=Ramlibacter pinisoli TaxID=2682844 RepID=A0A6N8J3W1_9BURK|nr:MULTISPECIES: hypothetical protein [Ramlibacter]MBA2963010.1 hypothetical protein [Ramlibacter sp. CGMCC 1.13660]MVQ32953.1 hypothetical protein [Ramlibacter pinisoli]